MWIGEKQVLKLLNYRGDTRDSPWANRQARIRDRNIPVDVNINANVQHEIGLNYYSKFNFKSVEYEAYIEYYAHDNSFVGVVDGNKVEDLSGYTRDPDTDLLEHDDPSKPLLKIAGPHLVAYEIVENEKIEVARVQTYDVISNMYSKLKEKVVFEKENIINAQGTPVLTNPPSSESVLNSLMEQFHLPRSIQE